jgi:hypothetical protein
MFLSKSAQTIENKGREQEKERQERKRVRKLLKTGGFRKRPTEKTGRNKEE